MVKVVPEPFKNKYPKPSEAATSKDKELKKNKGKKSRDAKQNKRKRIKEYNEQRNEKAPSTSTPEDMPSPTQVVGEGGLQSQAPHGQQQRERRSGQDQIQPTVQERQTTINQQQT